MNSNTLLLRQIHPSWFKDGRATSQAFYPTPKDNGFLSVHDGDQITAEAAWNRYTIELESVGVLGVTLAECELQQVRVIPDSQPDSPEHALLDFTGFGSSKTKRVARQLVRNANDRGWLFRVEEQVK